MRTWRSSKGAPSSWMPTRLEAGFTWVTVFCDTPLLSVVARKPTGLPEIAITPAVFKVQASWMSTAGTVFGLFHCAFDASVWNQPKECHGQIDRTTDWCWTGELITPRDPIR